MGALSTSIGMLILTRVIQGMGGGGLMVLSQTAPAGQRKRPALLGAFHSWCARGDLNPHALSDTGT